ncbi:MAG: DMT family transporter [Verrucomicrobiaceae bacterium]|nr:MAG: DMT family transporter [Verrucomicrobiaceae bacterium]
MKSPTPVPSPASSRLRMSTVLIAAGSSLLFCSKGVFAKCAYRHGADWLTVLALRMAFALPFFLVTGFLAARRRPAPLARGQWAAMAGLGFLGYYLSSVLNFAGLARISVGLERIVLYTYPSLVVLGSAVFLKTRLRLPVVAACLAAYAGIVVAFAGEADARNGDRHELLLGTALVFGSALTYAAFILLSGEFLRSIGPGVFTSGVVGFSGLFVLLHVVCTRPLAPLLHQPAEVYGFGAILAVFGTVLPSYLMGMGLQRAGAARFAIIGTTGPLMTVLLAWLILGESVNVLQAVGFMLSMAGGLAVSLLKEPADGSKTPAALVASSRTVARAEGESSIPSHQESAPPHFHR